MGPLSLTGLPAENATTGMRRSDTQAARLRRRADGDAFAGGVGIERVVRII